MSGKHVCMVVKNRLSTDARVKKEAAALAGDGWSVTVIAMPERGSPERETRGGIRIIRPPVYSGRKQRLRDRVAEASVPEDPSFRARVLRGIRKNPLRRFMADLQRDIPWELRLRRAAIETKADVYHAHDLDTLEICGIAAAKNGGRLVFDSHELWLKSTKYLCRTTWFNRIRLRNIERRFIYKCDSVIAVTPMRADAMIQTYPDLDHVEVLMNCPEKLLSLPERGLLREKLRIPSENTIVLYQGVFSPGRGLEQLIDAMGGIANKNISLVMIGMDAMNGALQDLVSEKKLDRTVLFLPPVPSEELASYTVDADIGVILFENTCLNNYYSLPNKLFEYMMASVPIVSSSFPELQSVIREAACGLTVNTGCKEEISDAIVQLHESPAKRIAFGKSGRGMALSKYNWEQQRSLLTAVYRKLIK